MRTENLDYCFVFCSHSVVSTIPTELLSAKLHPNFGKIKKEFFEIISAHIYILINIAHELTCVKNSTEFQQFWVVIVNYL